MLHLESVSIGVKITPGLVADNKPHMEPNGSKLSPAERVGAIALAAVTLLVTVGAPIVGMLWWRKNGRDQRYADLAPGTVPLAGQEARIVPNDPDIPIPVAFYPPPIPVAGGRAADRRPSRCPRDGGHHHRPGGSGCLTVQSYGKDDFQVTLVDPNKAAAPHEMVLLTALFEVSLRGRKDLSAPAAWRMRTSRCGIPFVTRWPLAAGSARCSPQLRRADSASG